VSQFIRLAFCVLSVVLICSSHAAEAKPAQSFRALLITGGCCHNYVLQTRELTNAVARLAKVEWTIVNEGGTGTRAQIPLYAETNWAKGYDVVVHNECFADTKDPVYIRSITAAHKAGTPAVVIHCAMHTYRATDIDDWREFLGVTSRRHDHLSNYRVKVVEPTHPIVKEMPTEWVTPKDELYVIEKLWPTAKSLASSKSEVDGQEYPVIWTNQYGQTRVMGTTFGHSDATFRDPIFLGYLARGILWAAGR
jgi:type 1 glutamine amidotransferase